MLERFRNAQQTAVERLVRLDKSGNFPIPGLKPRPSFYAALEASARGQGRIAVIAEYKRASPSQGVINEEVSPEEAAMGYALAGASCLSVLTEEAHFGGSTAYLERMSGPGLPLLRKDFLIHPLQVRESAATAASAVLLIARMLDDRTYAAMIEEAGRHGLECVLEVFDEADLERTRRVLERVSLSRIIIQVNNRDLETLTVSDEPSRRLIRHKRQEELWISASGVGGADDLRLRSTLGFDAALVGSSLMAGSDPGRALACLINPRRPVEEACAS